MSRNTCTSTWTFQRGRKGKYCFVIIFVVSWLWFLSFNFLLVYLVSVVFLMNFCENCIVMFIFQANHFTHLFFINREVEMSFNVNKVHIGKFNIQKSVNFYLNWGCLFRSLLFSPDINIRTSDSNTEIYRQSSIPQRSEYSPEKRK